MLYYKTIESVDPISLKSCKMYTVQGAENITPSMLPCGKSEITVFQFGIIMQVVIDKLDQDNTMYSRYETCYEVSGEVRCQSCLRNVTEGMRLQYHGGAIIYLCGSCYSTITSIMFTKHINYGPHLMASDHTLYLDSTCRISTKCYRYKSGSTVICPSEHRSRIIKDVCDYDYLVFAYRAASMKWICDIVLAKCDTDTRHLIMMYVLSGIDNKWHRCLMPRNQGQ